MTTRRKTASGRSRNDAASGGLLFWVLRGIEYEPEHKNDRLVQQAEALPRGHRSNRFFSHRFSFILAAKGCLFFKTGNQMTESEFLSWAIDQGIDADSVAVILECAAIPLKAKTVRTDCIYPPDDICDLFERDGFRVSPQKAGFVFVGYCANGDPIAVDVTHRPGSIWYINHEAMHSTPLRDAAVCVANDLRSAYASIVNVRDFPLNYHSAIRKQNT